MKAIIIIIFTLLLASSLQAEKRWVQSKSPKESHEEYDLLTCLDSNNCYAIGDLNNRIILYKSTDQGQSWSEVFEKFHIRDTVVRGNFKGIILDSNYIYLTEINRIALEKSTDGGHSFETILFGVLSTRSNEYFYDFSVYSKNISAGVSLSSLIYTNDNWESSTIVTLPDTIHSFSPIYFIDSINITFYRYDGFNNDFIKYNTESKSWSIWSRGEKREGEYKKYADIYFINDKLGFACGSQFTGIADYSNDFIWKTTDRGKTWIELMGQQNDPGFGMRRISFQNENHGIVVGEYGKIFETLNGGETWFQHPIQEEMVGWGTVIEWAGSVPLFAAWSVGIFRLETVTDVEELSSDNKFRVYQSGDNLEIAINDESYSNYKFSLYNSSGQSLMTRYIKSSFGFVFEPVELIDLTNGVYLYTISKNNGVEFTGKLVVVE
ncbi:MAG: hypothetical protein CVV25_09065 [Ignavibacteriae bacterium HGW-Ignavibacteriae-4]|jgi:hypothetical protein|nr:MAG: hypothetical protein CVV25_09065 [Ignavibacteriae bacterium HGW-Ignavibacteriae-4]